MRKTKLIVLEGEDRVGKEHLLEEIRARHPELFCYPVIDLSGVPNYEKTMDFVEYLKVFMRKQLDYLKEMAKTHDTIVLIRYIVSDEVFSELFGRQHIMHDLYLKEIEENFEIQNYCIVWKDYAEYLGRLKQIDEDVQYSKEELDKITELFLKNLKDGDKVLYITHTHTFEDVIKDFEKQILNAE